MDTHWKTNPILEYKLDELHVPESSSKLKINYQGTIFECLFLPASPEVSPNHTPKLLVSLGGGGRKGKPYPYFQRWKWKPEEYSMLCIDDPMYSKFPKKTHVMWYWGDAEHSFLVYVAEIVARFCSELNINKKDVIFIGDSGGGYSALYLANYLGSSAIAFNPQITPAKWSSRITDSFNSMGIDIASDSRFHRHQLVLDNPEARFFISVNRKSEIDLQTQIYDLFDQIDFSDPLNIGVYKHKNFTFWFYEADGKSKHMAFPLQDDLSLIFNLLNNDITEISAEQYMNIVTQKMGELIYRTYHSNSLSKYVFNDIDVKLKEASCTDLLTFVSGKLDSVKYKFKNGSGWVIFKIKEGVIVTTIQTKRQLKNSFVDLNETNKKIKKTFNSKKQLFEVSVNNNLPLAIDLIKSN